MTEAEARATGRPLLVGQRPMTRVGRAVEKGETQGFMKVVVDAETKQILGAAILGLNGDEAIHGMIDMMYAKAPYTVISAGGAHPPDGVGVDPDHAPGPEAALVQAGLDARIAAGRDLRRRVVDLEVAGLAIGLHRLGAAGGHEAGLGLVPCSIQALIARSSAAYSGVASLECSCSSVNDWTSRLALAGLGDGVLEHLLQLDEGRRVVDGVHRQGRDHQLAGQVAVFGQAAHALRVGREPGTPLFSALSSSEPL
jgi:hypothetical protein